MKSIIFFFSVLFSFQLMAQVVSNDKMKYVIAGLDNEIQVGVFGYKCEDVTLVANHGELKEIECGKYIFSTNSNDDLIITISSVKNGKHQILKEERYSVYFLPGEASILNKRSGTSMSIAMFRVQLQLNAPIYNYDINARYLIYDFEYYFMRGDSILYHDKNYGGRFNETFLKQREQLMAGDVVLITQIRYRRMDNRLHNLAPYKLTLK